MVLDDRASREIVLCDDRRFTPVDILFLTNTYCAHQDVDSSRGTGLECILAVRQECRQGLRQVRRYHCGSSNGHGALTCGFACFGCDGNCHHVQLKRCGLLDVVGAAELKILDNACGNGIVTETLLKSTAADTASWDIVLADFSPSMIEQAKARVESNGWKSATTVIADMQDMKDFKDGQFTHVVTNFGVMFAPNATKTLSGW